MYIIGKLPPDSELMDFYKSYLSEILQLQELNLKDLHSFYYHLVDFFHVDWCNGSPIGHIEYFEEKIILKVKEYIGYRVAAELK